MNCRAAKTWDRLPAGLFSGLAEACPTEFGTVLFYTP
jgi:hypothetical protein